MFCRIGKGDELKKLWSFSIVEGPKAVAAEETGDRTKEKDRIGVGR